MAFSLLVCILVFFALNLYNILVFHKNGEEAYAEIERPSGFMVGIAAFGTLIYFLEALLYLLLVFSGNISLLYIHYFQVPFLVFIQIFGLGLTFLGYFLFIWSVVVRGRYSVSWAMPKSQKLVTWGPYRYVRHPSYLGYFIMFFGLFFLWPTSFTLLPIIAIPGYYLVTVQEERLLTQRFGDEYLEYKKKTGRFIPRIKRH